MKKITVASLFILLLLAGSRVAFGQSTPRFQDYSVPVYKGRRAPVNLRSAQGASTFRTRLREGAAGGVNFAGHYSLVAWGCGTGCLYVGIVDAKTGTVYFPRELAAFGVWLFSQDPNAEALEFKPNSRLLILSGWPATEADSDNPKTGLYYYEWTGARLRLVKFVAKSREEGR
ncbi:MAG TPA: hypothetical protein VJS44_20580 [Pyrinomonadaceae bacterium]|nr:hypothetical protein [Pyrinomonadaceae bacterium]